MNADLLNAYRKARAHQMNVWASGGGMLTTDPSGKTELTYGSAPYGEHALSAYWSARRSLAFRKEAAAFLASHNKRSKAAKKAWKARKTK